MKKLIKILNLVLTKKFFIRLFLFSIFAIVLKKIITSPMTDTFVLGMMAFVSGLIAIHKVTKKGEKKTK